eukprot:TRINITY_DN4695_c0_g1_i1.p1 TRINITY_DN4695_c0_g1~~TRINITY_DN4695_c0_g1_i1.p1  ORF type:complete len:104 (+),score=8.31 TRINITY_DN4695_c0_g1_i1:1-312(+)
MAGWLDGWMAGWLDGCCDFLWSIADNKQSLFIPLVVVEVMNYMSCNLVVRKSSANNQQQQQQQQQYNHKMQGTTINDGNDCAVHSVRWLVGRTRLRQTDRQTD